MGRACNTCHRTSTRVGGSLQVNPRAQVAHDTPGALASLRPVHDGVALEIVGDQQRQRVGTHDDVVVVRTSLVHHDACVPMAMCAVTCFHDGNVVDEHSDQSADGFQPHTVGSVQLHGQAGGDQ